MSDEIGYYTKGSRKALGAMNAKLRAKVGKLERELAAYQRAQQPSAGVVMPEAAVLEDLEFVRVALRGFLPCIARTEGLRAVSRVIARLNGKGAR